MGGYFKLILNSIMKDFGSWSNDDLEVGAFLHHVRFSPCRTGVNWIKWIHSD